MGPPVGHKGVSHAHKPEGTRYYPLSACVCCGLAEHLWERLSNKIFLLPGIDGIRAVSTSAERA